MIIKNLLFNQAIIMKTFQNALEIYSLLNKSNCGECYLPTCMAFAGSVYTGAKKLSECPHIAPEVIKKYGEKVETAPAIAQNIEKATRKLKQHIKKISLSGVADQLGGSFENGKLTFNILGKQYSVDETGKVYTNLHVIPWLSLPVYMYIIKGGNTPLSGKWVPLRELPSGKDWFRLFGQRCEKPMKKLADNHPDLFADMVSMFNGKQVENHYSSDISIVLHPLPKVPMLICYWRPEDDLQSDLNLFFDSTAEDYLDLNSINSLASGFVTMLERLITQHGSIQKKSH